MPTVSEFTGRTRTIVSSGAFSFTYKYAVFGWQSGGTNFGSVQFYESAAIGLGPTPAGAWTGSTPQIAGDTVINTVANTWQAGVGRTSTNLVSGFLSKASGTLPVGTPDDHGMTTGSFSVSGSVVKTIDVQERVTYDGEVGRIDDVIVSAKWEAYVDGVKVHEVTYTDHGTARSWTLTPPSFNVTSTTAQGNVAGVLTPLATGGTVSLSYPFLFDGAAVALGFTNPPSSLTTATTSGASSVGWGEASAAAGTNAQFAGYNGAETSGSFWQPSNTITVTSDPYNPFGGSKEDASVETTVLSGGNGLNAVTDGTATVTPANPVVRSVVVGGCGRRGGQVGGVNTNLTQLSAQGNVYLLTDAAVWVRNVGEVRQSGSYLNSVTAVPYHWRTFYEPVSRGVLTLTQAATVRYFPTFVTGASGTGVWFPSSGAPTLSVVATRLRIAAGGVVGRAGYTYATANRPHLTYRFYRVKVASLSGAGVAVTFQMSDPSLSQWYSRTLTTGAVGVFSEHEIDLYTGQLSPANYALPGSRIGGWLISVPAGQTVEVEFIEAFRRGDTYITALEAPKSGTQTLGSVHAFTDGHVSLSAGTGAATIKAVKTIADALVQSGWTVSAGVADTDIVGGNQPIRSLEGWEQAIDRPNGTTFNADLVPSYLFIPPLSGEVMTAGDYGPETELTFRAHQGGQVAGLLTGGGTLRARNETTLADEGTGAADDEGFARTGVPHLLIPFYSSPNRTHVVDTTGTTSATFDDSIDGAVNADFDDSDLTFEAHNYSRWRRRILVFARTVAEVVAEQIFGPLAIDGVRQWLHRGSGQKVQTYHLATFAAGTPTLAFESADHSAVDSWAYLAAHPRAAGALVLVGNAAAGGVKVYASRNGGQTITEVHSVPSAASSALAIDSERATWILVYEDDTSGLLKVTRSKDLGATWETAADITVSGATVTGVVESLVEDPRAAAILLLSAVVSGAAKVYASRNEGRTWELKLS